MENSDLARDVQTIREKLAELSALYKEHWSKACQFEGADEKSIFIEFSSDNLDAKITVEIMKEMYEVRASLNYLESKMEKY